MKIIQFQVIMPAGTSRPEFYGLGDDERVYIYIDGKWLPVGGGVVE